MAKVTVKFTKVVEEEMEISDEMFNALLPTMQQFGLGFNTDEEEEVINEFYKAMHKFVKDRRDDGVIEELQVLLGFTLNGEKYDAD